MKTFAVTLMVALSLGLVFSCSGNSPLLNPRTGPGTDYPCGLHGHSCGNSMCCPQDYDCGGVPWCPVGQCCYTGGSMFGGVHSDAGAR